VEPLRFETGDGIALEGELRSPDGEAAGSAVICHPHPRQGGSKDHPVLWAVRSELAAGAFAVLSFNFRGVMGSEGEYGRGVTEVEDVRAAIGRARQEADGPTFVAGWSFGANVALREALDDERVGALALLGFPLSESSVSLPPLPDRARLRAFDRPVLLAAGAADPFCPVPELRALGRRLGHAAVEVVEATDHFFWHREREVARLVGTFAARELLDRRGPDGPS
jgi:alpha/beta superfamily hydrolase